MCNDYVVHDEGILKLSANMGFESVSKDLCHIILYSTLQKLIGRCLLCSLPWDQNNLVID